ncbi:MAG TPA: hypothetical protein VKX17_25800 [Planctomycetota bacterium]|nr:hypothetical protein [Planctomycetota bacterium]
MASNVPNGSGKKPASIERIKRQQRGSAIKFYITSVVLGGLCGLAYLERAEIKSAYDKLMSSAPVAPVVPAVTPETPKSVEVIPPKEAAKKIETLPPVETAPPKAVVVQPQFSVKDEQRAREILTEGRGLLEKFDFAAAGNRFADAAPLKLSPALADEVKLWKKKAAEFANATRHIAVADYAQGDNAVIVETIDGTEWRGLKTREEDDKIYVQVISETNPASEGKRTFPIPRNEIKKITPLPLKQRQADFNEMVTNLEGSIKLTHSTDLYDLVYLTKRLGLGKECVAYLNRAFDGGTGHAPDPNVGDTYRDVVVRRAIGRATLLMAANRRTQAELELKKLKDTLPGYAKADEDIATFRSEVMNKVSPDFHSSIVITEKKEPMKPVASSDSKAKKFERDDAVEISINNSGLTSTGAAGAMLTKANDEFGKGMSIIRTYQPGVGGNSVSNNKALSDAKSLFQQAQDDYDAAQKLEPTNGAIRSRQEEIGRMIYFCVKNMIFLR